LATSHIAGQDSIYVVMATKGAFTTELKKNASITVAIRNILDRTTKRSDYIWYGDDVLKTSGGDSVFEVSKEIKEQKWLLDTYADICYDKDTINPLLPEAAE